MKAKRLNWAKQWRNKDVDFWRSTVKHPTKIMIWSVISRRLYVVKGMMRQEQYKDILQNPLIPQLEEWFSNGEPCIFMQDGAPCHTARSIKDFLAEQNIPLLDWPADDIGRLHIIDGTLNVIKYIDTILEPKLVSSIRDLFTSNASFNFQPDSSHCHTVK
ncbi:putative transposase like protein [Trichonephila clavipes]|uniref:Putative transposase like protein n=1 Tax=Trichonephila clavipes TaxID=2585209 RepID=A0A8X6S4Y1_TRICX|nr:putative transposase like protein [Trichonephila clavipes]